MAVSFAVLGPALLASSRQRTNLGNLAWCDRSYVISDWVLRSTAEEKAKRILAPHLDLIENASDLSPE